jgi:hypothetical protein
MVSLESVSVRISESEGDFQKVHFEGMCMAGDLMTIFDFQREPWKNLGR